MNRFLSFLFSKLKFVLMIIDFIFTSYIMIGSYQRLDKSIFSVFIVLVPYFLLFILFVVSYFLKKKIIKQSIFYNLTCCLSFFVIMLVSLRTIFDKNMVLNDIMGYGINFLFFQDFLLFMNILLYGLIIGGVLLILCYEEE